MKNVFAALTFILSLSSACHPPAKPHGEAVRGITQKAESDEQVATSPRETPLPSAPPKDSVGAVTPSPTPTPSKSLKFGPQTCEKNATTATCYTIDASLNELSGITASGQFPGVFWVENDQGPAAVVYALNNRGEILSTQTLTGVTVTDTEDITLGPGPKSGVNYIYLGDIGDKAKTAGAVTVYRFPEPTVDPILKAVKGTVADFQAISLSYPSSQVLDFETMFIDPRDGDLYLVQKGGFNVFKAAKAALNSAQTGVPVAMTLVRSTGGWSMVPSGGNMSPAGDEIVLRDEKTAWIFQRLAGQSVADALGTIALTLPLGPEFNGEAISFDAKGLDLVTVSENQANSSNQPSPPQPVFFYRRLP